MNVNLRGSTRAILAILALVFAIVAAVLPTHWYDVLPRPEGAAPRPFSGADLLRLTFLIDALIAAFFAATGWRPQRDEYSGGEWAWRAPDRDLSKSQAAILVFVITIIATALRVHKIGSDLWLDEIATAEWLGARPLLEIFGAYNSPGNHLLNSVLVHISMALFGTSEAAVRLPAVLFGIAIIPAMYFAARLAMSRAASVAASALIGVSYHHIFFSQNARGYSGNLVCVLIGSALLASLLKKDSSWRWVAYVIAMSIAIASLMSAAFAIIAHVIVGTIAVISRKRRGVPVRPLVERLLLAFAATGLIAFHIYGIAVPDVLSIYPVVYQKRGSGYFFFSREFITEMMRGISAGFAFGIAVIPILLGAAAGFFVLARRNWAIALSLAGTVGVTVLFLVLRGQSVAPRLLLAGLPLAFLCLMATADALLRSSRAALAAGAAVAVISLIALPSYYSAPKQPFRAAIAYVENLKAPGQQVIVAYPGARGIRYYVNRGAIRDSADYRYLYNKEAFAPAVSDPASANALLVTTLSRVLRSDEPEVAAQIEKEFVRLQTFRGTLGDGSITIWKRKI